MINIISPILVASPFSFSEESVVDMAGYYGILDWTGLPCGMLATPVVAVGQVFCLSAFDGKSTDLKAFDGKSFTLSAIDEDCDD